MDDKALEEWLVDCRSHTSADRRLELAFLSLYQRCRQAEMALRQIRIASDRRRRILAAINGEKVT